MSYLPNYTILHYGDELFKVVAFKGNRDPDVIYLRDPGDFEHTGEKLDSAFSRARSMVLQYALCNPWEYFFTGTIDKTKFDRFDLDTYYGRLSQWIRDKRKVYHAKFQVLLVPEQHKNGAWHIHGLVHGLPASVLSPFAPPSPLKLINGGFLNWPDYQAKFGFCSLAPVRDPVRVGFYVSKYVSKELCQRRGEVGKHLYFHSRPLKKAVAISDVYGYEPGLDAICERDYDFCKVGYVQGKSWSFPFEWDNVELLDISSLLPLIPPDDEPPECVPEPEVFEQLSMM